MERKTKEVEEKEEIFYSPERIIEVNDEDENIKLGYLRAILDKQDPSCKEIDDSTLRRFLRARDLDAEKASRMFIKYLTWRRSFVPKGSISKSEVTNQIGMNKMFMQGTDKRGCPVSIFFGGRHFPSKGGNEELKRSRRRGKVHDYCRSTRLWLLQQRRSWIYYSIFYFTGLLPRKIEEIICNPCTLHIHGRVENYLPIH